MPAPPARAPEGTPAAAPIFVQDDQPEGVPPLALTGERTLPDVPEENYWYRRHLAVYEWIAARVGGLRVIDMACGEGYGSDLLARAARSVVGVDANPEAHEHAGLRYRRPQLRFARDLVETFPEHADVIVFLQTIEHLQDPGAVLAHFRSLVPPGAHPEGHKQAGTQSGGLDPGGLSQGFVFVSTPNVLTLAPKGAERSDNPWHVHEYRAEEFEQLCRGTFGEVEMYGLFHARKLHVHALALKLGWDAIHPRLRLTKRFYDWFTPAISANDFVLRPAGEADLDQALDFIAVCRP